MSVRRIFFAGLLAILISQALSAQVKMSVSGTANLLPKDADAVSYYRQMDVNDELCAILKVRPTNPLGATLVLNTGGGLAPVPPPSGVNARQDDGSWWFWVSPRVKNISFSAQGYTLTNTIGVSLSPGKVYEIKLVVDALVRQVQEFSLDEMVMKLSIEPMECIVSYGTDASCNMGRQVVKDGYFQRVLKKGLYHFKVEQSFYEPYVGVYRVDENSAEQKIVLQPSFGYLKINTNPEGAEVYVDGFTRSLGQTPLGGRKLSKGAHTLHIWKENYYSEDVTVDVRPDGLEQELPLVRLRPQFVNVTCLCEDKEADLTVFDAAGNRIETGKNGMQVRLNSHALYKLEASRPNHTAQSTGISLRVEDEGGRTNVTVGAPLPIYGGLQISSTPTRADVYLDGVKVGTTIYVGKVLSGIHTLELRKDGYWMDPVLVEVKRNETVHRNITLREGTPDGTLNISSNGSWVVRVAAKNGSYNERMYLPVYNLKLAPGTYTATIDGSSSNHEIVKSFIISSNKKVNLTMNPAERVLNAHVIGFTYGGILKKKSESDTNPSFLLGVSYTYLPSWIGPSVSLNFGFGGDRHVQPAAGITLGFPSDLNTWGGYYLTTRYVYSTNYRNGFEIGVSVTKFFYISAVYFPAMTKSELLIGFSLPFPFR